MIDICHNNHGEQSNDEGESKIFKYVRSGDVMAVKFLLDNGLDVHRINYNSESLLHIAATKGHSHMCDLLISYGCSTEIENRDGELAIEVACRKGFYKTVRSLVNGGSSVFDAYKERFTDYIITSGDCTRIKTKWELIKADHRYLYEPYYYVPCNCDNCTQACR